LVILKLYCYFQLLLTGDTETGRKSRTFSMAEPLQAILIFITMRKNILILISVLLFGCSTETKKLDYELIFGKQGQEFLVANNSDFILKGEKGTVVKITKDLIHSENETDSILFVLKEFYSLSDMIKAGLSTTSNGKLLGSKGMVFLQAFINKKEIALGNKPVDFTFAESESSEKYQVFYGVDNDRFMNWNLDTITNNYHIFYNYVIGGAPTDQCDQAIVETKVDSIPWNRNFSQIDTIGTYTMSSDTIYNFNRGFGEQTPPFSSYRFFRVLPYNWINLDIFLELDNLTTVTIESNKVNEPNYFCVFKKYNSIIPSFENTLNGVPIGEIASIIGIDFKDNEIYFDIQKEVEIEKDMSIKLNLKKTDKSEIESTLKELDRK